jgi:hypothetical protein
MTKDKIDMIQENNQNLGIHRHMLFLRSAYQNHFPTFHCLIQIVGHPTNSIPTEDLRSYIFVNHALLSFQISKKR